MIKKPYLMFIGDVTTALYAKTASGVKYWRPEQAAGQFRFPGGVDLGLPDYTMKEAAQAGLQTILIGVAPQGGKLPQAWQDFLVVGLEVGMDIASGLHVRLAEIPALKAAAEENNRQIVDVRFPTQNFNVGTGAPRSGKRLLTVGTDCAVGKMFVTLALEQEMKKRGILASFRATGQTGILIAGSGVSVDAVVSDFISGAAEYLSPKNAPDHWDLIEGQGSLFHPAYAGVSLGLLHGSQPDAIVVCHQAGRENVSGLEGYPLPSLKECIALNLQMGRRTNPRITCVGIGINTASLNEAAALDYLKAAEDDTGLPCVDPLRTGVGAIVDNMGL
ncbi:MAG: DUF1611 domain-containing protein [Emcibacter sp.]|nr:DUF1611 domain-containing protein [Emcibacter sp.]